MPVLAAMLLCLLILGASPARAAGHLEICNKGSVDISVAEIDWYGLLGEDPELSGWYPLHVGECYHKDGLGVDVSLAFEADGSDRTAYFYFDAPRLKNTTPFGSDYDYAGKVETTGRVACVDFANRFSRRTTQDQFSVCPAGWRKIPFNWHVVTCGELQNCSIALDVRPSLEQQRLLPDQAPPPVPPPAPSASAQPQTDTNRFPAGTTFGRLALPLPGAVQVFKSPGDIWRLVANKTPIIQELSPLITTTPLPGDAASDKASAILAAAPLCDDEALERETATEWAVWAHSDHRFTGLGFVRSVSLQNLDVSQAVVLDDQGCDRILIPCRDTSLCVAFYSENRGLQPGFRFELPIKAGNSDVNLIVQAIRQLSDPQPASR